MLTDLPNELIIEIICYCINFSEIAQTCKHFNEILKIEYLWIRVCENLKVRNGSFEKFKRFLLGQWDNRYKSSYIALEHNDTLARRTTGEGSNPAVLAKYPLTISNKRFTIHILSLGSWLSIGLATRQFVFDNDSVVGCQESIRSVGIYQHGGNCMIKVSGLSFRQRSETKFVYKTGDKLSFKLENNNVLIRLNNVLIGYLCDLPTDEKWYPCVSLSYGSVVQFQY